MERIHSLAASAVQAGMLKGLLVAIILTTGTHLMFDLSTSFMFGISISLLNYVQMSFNIPKRYRTVSLMGKKIGYWSGKKSTKEGPMKYRTFEEIVSEHFGGSLTLWLVIAPCCGILAHIGWKLSAYLWG